MKELRELEKTVRQLRHQNYLLQLAIRRYCKHCQGLRVDLINKCDQKNCPLWTNRGGPRGIIE